MALQTALNTRGPDLLEIFQAMPGPKSSADLIQRLVTINHLATAMASAPDIEHLVGHLSAAYAHWIPGSSIRLYLAETENHTSATAASVLKSGMPLLVDDFGSRSDWHGGQASLSSMFRSVMSLPLHGAELILGVLEVCAKRPRRFSSLDYHTSLLVASNLASALDSLLVRRRLTETNLRLVDQERRLTRLNRQLQGMVHTDELTGLDNRRRLMAQLDTEIARVQRYGGTFSCLMIDIDGFKLINDRWGHPTGDLVLRQLADLFRSCCRITDLIARYGGDEFAILLPETDAQGADCASRKLQSAVKEHGFTDKSGRLLPVAISSGIANWAGAGIVSADEIIARADQALYLAKRAGNPKLAAPAAAPRVKKLAS